MGGTRRLMAEDKVGKVIEVRRTVSGPCTDTDGVRCPWWDGEWWNCSLPRCVLEENGAVLVRKVETPDAGN